MPDAGDVTLVPIRPKNLPKKSPLKSIENKPKSNEPAAKNEALKLPTPLKNAINSRRTSLQVIVEDKGETIMAPVEKENLPNKSSTPLKSALKSSENKPQSVLKSALKSPVAKKSKSFDAEIHADTSLAAIFSIINQAPSPAPLNDSNKVAVLANNFAAIQSYSSNISTPTRTFTMSKKEVKVCSHEIFTFNCSLAKTQLA